MVRPFIDETVRYGQNGIPAEYSKPGEFVYDHPFQWGSKRTGPDLAREGGRRDELWHLRHFENPRATSPGSVMPSYPHLLEDTIEWDEIQDRVDVMSMLGSRTTRRRSRARGDGARAGPAAGREAARRGGPTGMDDKEVIALIAYMQRLGVDIRLPQGGSR